MNWLKFHLGIAVAGCSVVALPVVGQMLPRGGTEGDKQSLSMYAGVLATDNFTKARNASAKSRTEMELGLTADLRVKRERFESTLASDLQYRSVSYSKDGHQLSGGLHALSEFYLLQERLSWSVEDNLAQALVNSVDVASPANTQNTNILSTGPRWVFPLGARTSVAFDGKWTNVWYQKSTFGNNLITGRASVQRKTGASSELSLNGQVQRVKYKKLSNIEDYDIKSAFLGWLAAGARTTLQLDAGVTRISEKVGSASGALVSMEIGRALNANTELRFNAGRNFGSSADNLRLDQELRGISASSRPGGISADPMRHDYASAAWVFNGPRSSATLRGDLRRENHRTQADLNRVDSRGEFRISRALGPRFGLDFQTGYTRSKFNADGVDFTEWDIGTGLSWRANDALGVTLRFSHSVGTGDSSAGPGTRDYDENSGEFRLVYTPRF